jgi:pimeloyl-ACP methyl ester carboxylesterase
MPEDHRWWGRPVAETRWQLELARLMIDPVLWGGDVPRGDGRPVILVPGFLAGDQTLLVLAAWLRRIGYRPSTCGFVANVQCSDRGAERVERRAAQLHQRHGRRVAVIGHSRGGHYARAVGHRRPDVVSHAISVGAGLREMLAVSYPTEAAVAAARHAQQRTGGARSPRCLTEGCDCAFAADGSGSY